MVGLNRAMAMSQSKPNESGIFAINRNGSQRVNPLDLTQDVTFGYATVSLSSLSLGSTNLTQLQYVGLMKTSERARQYTVWHLHCLSTRPWVMHRRY